MIFYSMMQHRWQRMGWLTLLLVAIGCIALGSWFYWVPITSPHKEATITLRIEPDTTGQDIADMLYEKGLIRSVFAFKVAMRMDGVVDKLQAGSYRIPTTVSMHTLLTLLQQGGAPTKRVTFPEGFTIQQVATRLEEEGVVTKKAFLDEARVYVPYAYMYGPSPETYHVEGFLFPDTYEIAEGTTSHAIIKMMTREMNEKLDNTMRAAIAEKGLSIYEFVTLASIVEREALFDEDRPIIAAVFLKRLREQMPLQSCATIEYVLGVRKPFLSEEDTRIDSPYNTYRHAGLPPGPIGNPGMASMRAVLEAKDTPYLFFVADAQGHHHFTRTYEEHLAKIERLYGTH